MSQRCQVCMNINRLSMEKKMIRGIPISSIAKEYGGVSENSLHYHKKHHLSRQLIKYSEIREMLSSKVLLQEIKDMITKTKDLMTKAENDKWYGVAISGIKEWRHNLEFLIKLGMTLKLEKDEEQKQEQDSIEEKLRRLSRSELELLVKLNQKMEGKRTGHGAEIRIEPSKEIIDIEPVEPVQEYRRRDHRIKPEPVPRARKPFNTPDPVPILDIDDNDLDNEIRDSEGYTESERMQIRPPHEIAGYIPSRKIKRPKPGDPMDGPVRTSRDIGL